MNTLEIIRQIESDPALAAQLRAVLLGDAFLHLPEQVAENTRAIASLTEQVAENTRAIASLAAAQERTEQKLARVAGWQLESEVRSNPERHLWEHFRDVKVVDSTMLAQLIERLDKRSRVSAKEIKRLRNTDLIAKARYAEGDGRVTIVGEVSVTLHLGDVVRAHESAEIISSRGDRAVAVALGADLGADEVVTEATRRGVLLVCVG